MNTTQKLTPAQVTAAKKLIAGETIHCYNGTTRATARALVALGIAKWAFVPFVQTEVTRGGRPRYTAQWGIVASDELSAKLAAKTA